MMVRSHKFVSPKKSSVNTGRSARNYAAPVLWRKDLPRILFSISGCGAFSGLTLWNAYCACN